jgi:hypothetical protein
MTYKFRPVDYDIIYLSYDEPNAEKNYADLCTKVPWAKRVHGVEGSDAAHKACAKLSETDRFITVDGDNKLRDGFLDQEIDIDDNMVLDSCVISWCGENIINGLVYGNGGIKCWPKSYVERMQTHENADPKNKSAQVDFCWDAQYIQQNSCFSDVYNNETPQQAWRAGFREGVKLALDRGNRVDKEDFLVKTHWRCLHMLYVWTMIGSDIKNGNWAIYGAREGLYRTMCTKWDFVNVRDFDYLNTMWNETEKRVSLEGLQDGIEDFGDKLIKGLNIPISSTQLNPEQSKFFKNVYKNPTRDYTKLIDIEDGANG